MERYNLRHIEGIGLYAMYENDNLVHVFYSKENALLAKSIMEKDDLEPEDEDYVYRLSDVLKFFGMRVCDESLGEIASSITKQMPMQVTDIYVDEYYCPACGAENICDVGIVRHKYCPECGQRLKVEQDYEQIDT